MAKLRCNDCWGLKQFWKAGKMVACAKCKGTGFVDVQAFNTVENKSTEVEVKVKRGRKKAQELVINNAE